MCLYKIPREQESDEEEIPNNSRQLQLKLARLETSQQKLPKAPAIEERLMISDRGVIERNRLNSAFMQVGDRATVRRSAEKNAIACVTYGPQRLDKRRQLKLRQVAYHANDNRSILVGIRPHTQLNTGAAAIHNPLWPKLH
jgi:hypothetical protein